MVPLADGQSGIKSNINAAQFEQYPSLISNMEADVQALFPNMEHTASKLRFALGNRDRHTTGEFRRDDFHPDLASYSMRVCLRLCTSASHLHLTRVGSPGAAMFHYEVPPYQVCGFL